MRDRHAQTGEAGLEVVLEAGERAWPQIGAVGACMPAASSSAIARGRLIAGRDAHPAPPMTIWLNFSGDGLPSVKHNLLYGTRV